jgi:dipeptidyl aminopeptidase/acylaminoacyl peptidase
MKTTALTSAFAFSSLAMLMACGGTEDATTKPAVPVASASAMPTTSASTAPTAKPAGHAPTAPVAIDEYMKMRRIRGLSFSFDEKNVAYMTDEGGRPDVWVKPLGAGPETKGKQITHVKGFVHSFAFSPSADVLAYEADVGGDELPHLFLTNANGDAPKDVVADLPAGRRTQLVRWTKDGRKLLFLSSRRDEKQMDLWELDAKSLEAKMLWKSEGAYSLETVDPMGERFIVSETRGDADNDLFLVERAKPEKKTLLTKHPGDVLHNAFTFSKDNRSLWIGSDEGAEFTSLHALDLKTFARTPLLKSEWDVAWAGYSSTQKYSFTVSNVDGAPDLVLTEVATSKKLALPAAPTGLAWDPVDATRSGPFVIGFSKSDRYLGVVARGDTSAPVPYVIDLKENKATPIADPRPDALRDRAMVTGKSVRIASFDGKEVPAFVYAPAGTGPFPAVIDVHGGPTAQSRRDFAPLRQYLVSKGYVVLVPNVRGSTGYGKTWTRLDNMDLGGGPLKDVVACKKWMAANANVAADRVVVLGGSYGGYMALAAATFTPDEFVALVDYFGVGDLKTLVESFPPYWQAAASYIYKKFGDPKNPDHAAYQHDRSPIHFVDRVTKPLLVIQGDKDPRVKKDQSDRMVDKLKARGVPVHYLVLTDEGHGFTKNENFVAAYKLTDRFLDRYVWGDESVHVE